MFGAIDYGKPIGRPPQYVPHNNLQNELGQVGIGWQEARAYAQAPYYASTPSHDMVRQPSHYARYVIEPVTFIGANKLPFDVGNVIKYVCRYDAKNGIEDLEKAKRYVEIVIERVKREARIDNGERAETVWSEII